MKLSPATISFHLSRPSDVGLLTSEQSNTIRSIRWRAVNQILVELNDDVATLRRLLIVHGLMAREEGCTGDPQESGGREQKATSETADR